MRTRTLLLALVALVLAIVGCEAGDTGDTGDTEDPVPTETDEGLERISEAAENTVEEGTARFTLTVETGDTATTDTGVDADDDPDAPATTTTAMVEAEGEEDFEEERRRLVVQGPQGELEIIVDGSELYLQLPATEDEQWARADINELAEDGVGFGGPGGVPFQDSRSNLEVLQDATGDVSEVGEEDVQGEPTTQYELTINLQDAAALAEDDAAGTLEQLAEQTGLDELDMQVWVGDDDLIRRVAYTVDLGQIQVEEDVDADGAEDDPGADIEADPQGAITVTVEYYDFGTELDIELPDDENVIDLDEEQLRRSFGQPSPGQTRTDGTTGTDGATGSNDTSGTEDTTGSNGRADFGADS